MPGTRWLVALVVLAAGGVLVSLLARFVPGVQRAGGLKAALALAGK